MAGIKPIWLSEVSPFATLVTHCRLPQVKHYGDVNKLKGSELEPVDIVTFGSPCQDLSVAGRREGLIEGQRSSLFFEAIRIIKEMREATNGKKPRYAVFENVGGLFNSNGGKDFNAVLDAFVSCVENGVSVPAPKTGIWPKSDILLGDGWSVAYRTFDAQYWGVPQRRTRIYLVADFASERAGEILFECEGVSRDPETGFCTWQGAAGSLENGTGAAGFYVSPSAKFKDIGYNEEKSPTLRATEIPAAMAIENHAADSRVKISDDGKVQTLTERMGTGGGNVPMIAEPQAYSIAREGFNSGEKADFNFSVNEEISPTLGATGPHAVAFGICSKDSNGMKSDNPKVGFYEAQTSRTLDQAGGNPSCNQGGMAIVEAYDISNNQAQKIEVNKSLTGSIGQLSSHQGGTAVVNAETYDVRFTSDGTKNVRNHCYETDIARCLDSGGMNPDANHGGVAIVALEPGAASRVGSHIYTDGKSGALRANAGDNQQAVVFHSSKNSHHTTFTNDTAAETLVATDYKDPPIVNEANYVVRRLTPTECARLQGFPSWWCDNLEILNPSDKELDFWQDVWDTWDDMNGKKHKTKSQIKKWLADPYSDAEEYRLWGNGVALPCPFHVLKGIALEN